VSGARLRFTRRSVRFGSPPTSALRANSVSRAAPGHDRLQPREGIELSVDPSPPSGVPSPTDRTAREIGSCSGPGARAGMLAPPAEAAQGLHRALVQILGQLNRDEMEEPEVPGLEADELRQILG